MILLWCTGAKVRVIKLEVLTAVSLTMKYIVMAAKQKLDLKIQCLFNLFYI